MPLVKPTTTGRGMKLHRGAQAGRAQDDEHDAGHHRAHEQAVDAVGRDDAGDDDDEGAGRPADLEPRAAERRDEEAGDDRAVEPACGGTPEEMANAIASGSATRPTVTPAIRSATRPAAL